jgi:hypothetical protein
MCRRYADARKDAPASGLLPMAYRIAAEGCVLLVMNAPPAQQASRIITGFGNSLR